MRTGRQFARTKPALGKQKVLITTNLKDICISFTRSKDRRKNAFYTNVINLYRVSHYLLNPAFL